MFVGIPRPVGPGYTPTPDAHVEERGGSLYLKLKIILYQNNEYKKIFLKYSLNI